MLNAHQISSMTDAQMDEFLKSLLFLYLERHQGMDSMEILNAILNFAQGEGIIENQDNDHKKHHLASHLSCADRDFDVA